MVPANTYMVQPSGSPRGPTVTILSKVPIVNTSEEDEDDDDGDDL